MIKDAVIRISLLRWHEVPSRRSDSGKLDRICFGRITRNSDRALGLRPTNSLWQLEATGHEANPSS
jgi:hypothetical protein